MNESDFWDRLEYRLCEEMAGSELCKRHGLWCDGIAPYQYRLEESSPRIEGMAWIGIGKHQERWQFTLFLPQAYGNVTEIDWAKLLPSQGATDWLAISFENKRMDLRPALAIPDADHERLSLERLKHAVQRLALSATEQVAQFTNAAVVANALALDFHKWRSVCESSRYLEDGALREHVRLLGAHLDVIRGENKSELWTAEALHSAPEWESVRSVAKDVLATANWPHAIPPTTEQIGN